jgi:crossover junction endodeoxyribonuclease RusA
MKKPDCLRIVVEGRPVPKQRPRKGRNGKLYTPRETREYEEHVGLRGREQFVFPLRCSIDLGVTLYFNNRHTPDMDNCLKSIMDGLNGIAYEDDRQIRKILAELKYDDRERAEVEIREYEEGIA